MIDIADLLGRAEDLFLVAVNAANKLNSSMVRREIEPRNEFDRLVAARDSIYAMRKELREAKAAITNSEGSK